MIPPTQPTAVDILRAARATIKSGLWVGTVARNALGQVEQDMEAYAFLRRATNETKGRNGTKAFALRSFDRAITLAEQSSS